MVRTKSKIYGEPVNPDTVLAETVIPVDQFILGDGNKMIKGFDPGPNAIVVVKFDSNADGTISILRFHGLQNMVIGTDDNGDVVLLEMV